MSKQYSHPSGKKHKSTKSPKTIHVCRLLQLLKHYIKRDRPKKSDYNNKFLNRDIKL